MKILFLCRRYPYPLDRGDNRRNFHLAEGLAKHAQVRVLCLGEGGPLPIPGVSVRTVGTGQGSRRLIGPDAPAVIAGNALRPDPRLPLQVRASLDWRFSRAVDEELERWAPDVVHASPSTMAIHLPGPGSCRRHLDLIDALSVVVDGQARAARGPTRRLLRVEAGLLRRFEARAVQQADSASLVSAADKEKAPGLDSAAIVPLGVSARQFPFASAERRPPVVVFTGNLSWPPNIEAVGRIVTDVLPALRKLHAGARLRIVGTAAGAEMSTLSSAPGVDLVGRVSDIAAELHGAACALAPMWSGAGMKFKILEAFSAGTPVVTNARGAEGIDGVEPGTHALLEEEPEDMARACGELLTSPSERVRLGENAAQLVRARFSWDSQTRRLLEVYGGERG